MKYLLILGMLLSSSVVFGQKPSAENYETAYMQALEYVYNKDYFKAKVLLESVYDQVGQLQVAETLAGLYFDYIEDMAIADKRRSIEEEYPQIRSRLEAMLQKHPEQNLFRSSLKVAFLLQDFELTEKLARTVLAGDPENTTANGILAFASAQNKNNPDEIIAAYAKIARSETVGEEEENFAVQARREMARAYQMKGQERISLKYMRLADRLQKYKDLSLASLEFLFLNFPYAIVQMEQFGIKIFNRSQRTIYLGALFAEGSPESLKKMDALLSSEKVMTAYEEALSLHRRGINPRALLALESEKDPIVRKIYPWLYLDLRYKILSRLEDKEKLIPVAESMGGQAYLLEKRALALSYLTNLEDGAKGELSYLLGTLYFKGKSYREAQGQMLKHLKAPDAQYKGQALSILADIAFRTKDYKNAEKYIGLYEQSETPQDAAVSRGLLALRLGNYTGAQGIFSGYLSQLYGENARKVAGYQIASLYLEEGMNSPANREALLAEALAYVRASYDIVRKQQEAPTAFFDLNVYNLYAYCHALLAKGSALPQDALAAAEYAAALSPNPAFLDTAALVFFEAGDLGDKTRGAEFYFSALEKEMALIDQEIEYCRLQAPPFFDPSAVKDAQYYEIYMHLAAWHNHFGRTESARKAAAESLRLAEDTELARSQLEALQNKWKK